MIITTLFPPYHVTVLETTASTQDAASELWAASLQDGPIVVRALSQTAGRGKVGRSWAFVSGNLAFSCVQQLDIALEDVPALALLAVTALSDALQAMIGVASAEALRHKWPNDLILWDPKASRWAKMGGALIEVLGENTQGVTVCLGVGLNTAKAPPVPGILTACIQDLVDTPLPEDFNTRLCAGFMDQWFRLTARFLKEGWPFVGEVWSLRGPQEGDRMCALTAQGTVCRGVWAGLNEKGAVQLQIEGTGALQTFYALDTLTPEMAK